ncbi:MAG: hypothetical protein QNK31_02140 [Porticoccus sp.]|nr:hypothetical protein [Porticoccus sp.]
MSANTFAAFGGLVPLSWSGQVSYGYGYSDSGGNQSESTSLTLGVGGTGYIWRPWFATTSMALNVSLSNSETSSSSSDATSAGGSFSLGVFPGSRFPFSLDYSLTDSRSESFQDVSGSSGESTFQVTRWSLRQSYRPRSYGQLYNAWYYLTNYDGESFDSENIGYGLDYSLHVSHQTVKVVATHSETKVKDVSTDPTIDILTINHVYTPSNELGVNSMASVLEVDPGDGSSSKDSQAFSSFYWRPEHRAVNVSGGVRLSESEFGRASSSVTRSLSTNLSLGYRVTRALNVNANAAVGTSDSDGSQTLSTAQAVNASYNGGRHQIAGLAYTWQGGGGVSNSTTRTEVGSIENSEDVQALTAGVGHNISGSWPMGPASSISTGVSQAGAGNKNSETDLVSKTLSHSANLSWNNRSGRSSAFVSGRISDSRNFGENESVFNDLSVSASGDYKFSRLSGMQGNMIYSASRNDSDSELEGKLINNSRSLGGGMGYQHSRPFGVYNLQFTSSLTGSKQINSPQPTTIMRWEGLFRYSLGQLTTSLTFRASETAGSNLTKSMNFQATRSF